MNKERCILVSGGSRGLGLALVNSFLSDGHRVASFSRRTSADVAALLESHPDRFVFAECDMTQTDGFRELVRGFEKRVGRISGLVNNAGIVAEELLARQDPADIEKLLAVNLAGPLHLTRAAVRGMMIDGGGSIVNVS